MEHKKNNVPLLHLIIILSYDAILRIFKRAFLQILIIIK